MPGVKTTAKGVWRATFPRSSLQGFNKGIPVIDPLQLTVLLAHMCLKSINRKRGSGVFVCVSHPLHPSWVNSCCVYKNNRVKSYRKKVKSYRKYAENFSASSVADMTIILRGASQKNRDFKPWLFTLFLFWALKVKNKWCLWR